MKSVETLADMLRKAEAERDVALRRALAAEGKLAIRTMRLGEAEQLLGLARSCLAGALGDDIDSYFA